MAKEKKSEVELIDEYVTNDLMKPVSKKQKEKFKASEAFIDEYIEHASPLHKEDAKLYGYKGSSLREVVAGKDGKETEKWTPMGLQEVVQQTYINNVKEFKDILSDKDKKEQAHVHGLEHFVVNMLESLRDHDEAQSALKTYKKDKKKGHFKGKEQEQLSKLAQMAKDVLYIDQNTLQTYLSIAQQGDIGQYTKLMRNIANTLPDDMIDSHKTQLYKNIKGLGAENYMKGKIYHTLHEDDRPQDTGTVAHITNDELLQTYHARKVQEMQRDIQKKQKKVRK